MHPYWGKAYNPLFSITLSEMLIIQVLITYVPFIRDQPTTLYHQLFTLIDLLILLRCLGSTGGNRHSAIGEVTTTLLKQLPRPIPCGNTHTWHVGHSHVNRGPLSTRGYFFWLSRRHSQHVTINTSHHVEHSHVVNYNCHRQSKGYLC